MHRTCLILLACLPLAACGGMAGTYLCEDVGYLDSVELTRDGKVYAQANVFGNVQKTAGTWKVDGDRLITDVSGQSNVFDIKDGNLVLGKGQCTRQ